MAINWSEYLHDPKDIKEHLDHIDCLEVATYGNPVVNVTVECTRCGAVVQELYDAGWEDQNEKS